MMWPGTALILRASKILITCLLSDRELERKNTLCDRAQFVEVDAESFELTRDPSQAFRDLFS